MNFSPGAFKTPRLHMSASWLIPQNTILCKGSANCLNSAIHFKCFLGFPVRMLITLFKSWGFKIPHFYWRWENWWSRSAEGPGPVRSGSTVITVRLLSCRPLRAEGAGSGKQVESVGLASRPGAAGRKGGGLVLHLLFLCLYVTYVLVNWNHM